MYTSMDVYEAWQVGQEWWRKQLKQAGVETPKLYTWDELPEIERHKYEIMARELNKQLVQSRKATV